MLLEVLGIALEILSKVAGVLGIVQFIQQYLPHIATEDTSTAILTIDQSTNNEVANAVWGTAALHNQLISLSTQLADGITQLSTQMGNPMQVGATIPLPPTPPAGYGGADVASIWNYQFPPGSGNIMGDQLNDAAYGAQNLGSVSELRHPYASYTWYHFDYSSESSTPAITTVPLIDPTTILPTDTDIVEWLNRTDTAGFVWILLNTKPISYSHTSGGDEWWICDMTLMEFYWWRDRAGGVTPATGAGAPVWPGLANVVLGATLTLADGLLVPGPLDGVISTIADVAYPSSFYPFGPIKSYVKVASIAFVDDDGQAEWPQPLSFEKHIVCPRMMLQADHAYCRVQTGTIGTVTPWTKI